jgi:hypothetical protein
MAATSHSVKNKIFKYYNNIGKEKYLLLICNRSRHDYAMYVCMCGIFYYKNTEVFSHKHNIRTD